MSTRSLINVKCSDGKVRSSYCHFDGSSHLGTLMYFYNSQDLAEQLVSLGDLSVLGDFMDCPEGHSFDNPIEGYTVAYGRDRGEDDTEAEEFDSFKAAWRRNCHQEFVYEWDGKWTRYKYTSQRPE